MRQYKPKAVKLIKSSLLCVALASVSIKLADAAEGSSSLEIKDESKGTAIFFEWLDDRFVVATDSLETHHNKPTTFDDCKIVV